MDLKKIGLISALSWIVASLILVNTGIDYAYRISAGLSLLFLLIAIFIAVRNHFGQDGRTLYLDDVKAAMRQAAIFVLLVSGFTFVYFRFINPEVLSNKVERDMAISRAEIEEAGGWEAFVEEHAEQNPTLKEKSMEDHLDDLQERKEMIISAGSAFLGSLVSLLSISFIYSLIITLIYRKFLAKLDHQ